MNRKIKNAKEFFADGIKFKSKLEMKAYKILKENGLSPKYEAEKVVLFNGFKPSKTWYIDGVPQVTKKGNNKKLIDWCYTPDFKIELNDHVAYFEIKGFPNDVYPYKRKLFLEYIDDIPKTYFFEIKEVPDGLIKAIEIFKSYATDIVKNKN